MPTVQLRKLGAFELHSLASHQSPLECAVSNLLTGFAKEALAIENEPSKSKRLRSLVPLLSAIIENLTKDRDISAILTSCLRFISAGQDLELRGKFTPVVSSVYRFREIAACFVNDLQFLIRLQDTGVSGLGCDLNDRIAAMQRTYCLESLDRPKLFKAQEDFREINYILDRCLRLVPHLCGGIGLKISDNDPLLLKGIGLLESRAAFPIQDISQILELIKLDKTIVLPFPVLNLNSNSNRLQRESMAINGANQVSFEILSRFGASAFFPLTKNGSVYMAIPVLAIEKLFLLHPGEKLSPLLAMKADGVTTEPRSSTLDSLLLAHWKGVYGYENIAGLRPEETVQYNQLKAKVEYSDPDNPRQGFEISFNNNHVIKASIIIKGEQPRLLEIKNFAIDPQCFTRAHSDANKALNLAWYLLKDNEEKLIEACKSGNIQITSGEAAILHRFSIEPYGIENNDSEVS